MSNGAIVHRAFVTVGAREVHYRMIGQGPPALFVHSSPTNSSFVLDDMRAQADRYTCIAFDTPGFGLSDPLPLETMAVADLAAATADAMAALGLPPLPVFGTHSGAAIALEMGYRYPDKFTGLVLDGVPIFTRDEVAVFADDRYFAPLIVDPLGGHYAATWTRFRDQGMWFPWYSRSPGTLNDNDLGTPEVIHRWVEMFFAAAAHYSPAYRACVAYCDDALTAIAGLTVPAVFTARSTDMLHPHLKRVPPLRGDQTIEEIGTDMARKHRLTAAAFARFGSTGDPPAPSPDLAVGDRIHRRFLMDDGRAQILRHAGDRDSPVLLLLHDTPGSGRMSEARMRALAAGHFVVAPDIPGSGESEGLSEHADMADYAQAMLRLCDALGVIDFTIEATGLGTSLGIEIAATAPGRCHGLAMDGAFLPDPPQRAALQARYAPPITIEADGAHWYRLWLMLRDSLVYWPWYDTRRVALRRTPADFAAAPLHERTIETMKQAGSYHRYIGAALRHDAAARLVACSVPVARRAAPGSALGEAYGDALDAHLARAAKFIEGVPA